MNHYSVIELSSYLPEIEVDEHTNFTSIMRRYDPSFDISNTLPAEYQGKVHGWVVHLDIILHRVVVFVLINPTHNFDLIKHFYDEFDKLKQYGFIFDASNINVIRSEYERIFGGTEKETTEFVFLDAVTKPTHL
jgi:hypothetical protein